MKELNFPIALGSDHAGLELKQKVIKYLEAKAISFKDYGTYSSDSVDYPDYTHKVARAMVEHKHEMAVLICGTGIGVSITANRYKHIRCALCWDVEIASLARRHNNSNVLALPGRFLEESKTLKIVETFLSTEFEAGRHQTRVDKMNCV